MVGARAARGGAQAREVGVAQHAQQVAEVLLGAQHAGLLEHARVGLLDEVLGVLARAAQRPGGAVEPVEMVAQVVGIQAARRGADAGGGGVRGSAWSAAIGIA